MLGISYQTYGVRERERERQIRGGEGSEPSSPASHPLGCDDGRLVLTRQTVERAAVDREREERR
uniref:Uncharacterized protein n=1 Tax=Helianthus annuus TaxID=4232 RepID=A0A251VC63_HELAN